MKSICIKTNNKDVINYLLNNINTIPLKNIYFINKHFKIYENIIIHYKGNNLTKFYNQICTILANCIKSIYEPILLKKIINYNYFYFDDFDKKIIENYCVNLSIQENDLNKKDKKIYIPLYNYLLENKSLILDGFIHFRLAKYLDYLENIVDYSINKYIIEKEYNEFINLLKIYISTKESEADLIHLIYTNGESILLNENKNIIPLSDNILDSKYLSDITFSSNDYALNTLLTINPKKIQIHLIGCEDEFIQTLKLIFEKKIIICTNCTICKTYKILNNVK